MHLFNLYNLFNSIYTIYIVQVSTKGLTFFQRPTTVSFVADRCVFNT